MVGAHHIIVGLLQINAKQAFELYKITRDFASLSPTDIVYDLYTGTGTIALFIAKQVKKVIGVEYVEAAIEDAKINASFNKIDNVDFYAGDMKDVLNNEFIVHNGKPDVVIVDPPRAGMHQTVIDTILKANPKRIIYVSCNPATQARDIALLSDVYQTQIIQPVDMFPHTHHVENVALLERK
jgi:23S rRNA (uracil1939-C5)-methyltransferase